MKIRITLKDPDSLLDAVTEAVDNLKIEGVDEDEMESVREKRVEKIMDLAGDWFEYSEYVTLELDTDAKTMTVVDRKILDNEREI